jgi:hypothetical protein
MAVYRVAMQFPFDSTLPRDLVTINPHYFGDNPGALLAAIKTNLNAWAPTAGKQFTLKAYDAAALPPSYPLATVVQDGTLSTTPIPREIALCLSYYTTYNRPRYRGRLFLPASWFSVAPGVRPTATAMQEALAFATAVLSKSLPATHNWVLWSRVARKSQGGVSDVWVDDEWDTVRSRGLRATERVTGKV